MIGRFACSRFILPAHFIRPVIKSQRLIGIFLEVRHDKFGLRRILVHLSILT